MGWWIFFVGAWWLLAGEILRAQQESAGEKKTFRAQRESSLKQQESGPAQQDSERVGESLRAQQGATGEREESEGRQDVLGAGIRVRVVPYRETFEGGEKEWRAAEMPAGCRISLQRRQGQERREGEAAQQIRVETSPYPGQFRLEYPIPPSRGVADIMVRAWVKADRPGVTLGLRLVFPQQIDPRTGKALTRVVDGDFNQEEGVWKPLTCTVSEAGLKSELRLLRKLFEADLTDIDKTGWYVDRVVLSFDRLQGTTECFIDDVVLSPHVPLEQEKIALVSLVESEADLGERMEIPRAEVRLDRLTLEGRPTFLRMVPHHGESAEFLSSLGFNPVWVRDVSDRDLIRKLSQQGIATMATPPEAVFANGGENPAEQVSMLPFEKGLDPVVFWMLGNGISAEERKKLIQWVDQIKDADRKLSRPLLADITGLEKIYSRYIPLMGLSRPVLNSSLGYRDYRDWLTERQKLARPGTFAWTWIQTDPISEIVKSRNSLLQTPVSVHYEQMRLQLYAALAGGCRSVGYWSTGSLEEDSPGGVERRLSIKQLNLELLLLEDLLATGELQGQLPLQMRTALPPGDHAEAAVFKTSSGMLILPVWYDRFGQFVPGQMVGEKVEILINGGIPEASTVWEISTTGVRNLPRKQVAGGTLVEFGRLNTTGAIFVPQDERTLERIKGTVTRIAGPSAETAVELARVKLDTTRAIDRELASLGVDQPKVANKLKEATAYLSLARDALSQRNYHSARQNAEYACQSLRILQRVHWNYASGQRAHPVSSPHLIAFESLPDHWRMVSRVGRLTSGNVPNLLTSGGFEDREAFTTEWGVETTPGEGVQAAADLHASGGEKGTQCLRLSSGTENLRDVARFLTEPQVRVMSPGVPVERGGLVHVRGRVRVKTAPIRTLDGLRISDSVGGEALALSFRNEEGWQEFEMLRTPSQRGMFQISFSLQGLGEVWLDDVSVRTVVLETIPEPVVQTGGEEGEEDSTWKRITRLKGFAPRDLIPATPTLPELDFLKQQRAAPE